MHYFFVENKKFPKFIMGSDFFTGWFNKDVFKTEKERANVYKLTLEMAYSCGVRGFIVEWHDTLIEVLYSFKNRHEDIICISNYHYNSHYFYRKESLWSSKNREKIISSILRKTDTSIEVNWFDKINRNGFFFEEEIEQFFLNTKEYEYKVFRMSKLCDFCIVGNLWYNSLFLLNRQDIIEEEIDIVRKYGLIPVGINETGNYGLSEIQKLNISISFTWINEKEVFPNLKNNITAINNSKIPLAAFRILNSQTTQTSIIESLNFIKHFDSIKSVLIGVDNPQQAKETFSLASKLFNQQMRLQLEIIQHAEF